MGTEPARWVASARRMLPGHDIVVGHGRPHAAGWSSVRDVYDPDRWPHIARAYARGIGSHVDAMGASCAVQGFAGRVLGPLIAVWAAGYPVPKPSPDDVWVRLRRGRSIAVAYRDAPTTRLDVDELVATSVALIEPVVRAVRAGSPVTERVLWGNIGAACAGPLGAAYRETADRDRTAQAARDLLSDDGWPGSLAVGCEEWDGLPGPALIHRRETCCLIHLAPEHGFCPGCSRLDETSHRERWTARIAATAR